MLETETSCEVLLARGTAKASVNVVFSCQVFLCCEIISYRTAFCLRSRGLNGPLAASDLPWNNQMPFVREQVL